MLGGYFQNPSGLIIVRDIISNNWDGLIPPDLSGTSPDLTATQGYAFDASAGSAQFNGRLFVQGELKVGEDADVTIGGPGSTDSQLHVHNVLEHLALFETDDPDYPDWVFVHDVNGEIGRMFWIDKTGGAPVFITSLLLDKEGYVDANTPEAGWRRAGLPAYTLKEIVEYTSSDSFDKGDYDGIKGIFYRLQAGAGGSGGCATTGAAQVSGGGSGGGGEFIEGWVDESDLAASEAVTIGAGGTAAAAGNNNGGNGGDTVLDTISGEARANGGTGGQGGAATVALTGVLGSPGNGGSGGAGTGMTAIRGGDDGIQAFTLATNRLYAGVGGGSMWGGQQTRSVGGGSFAAIAGKDYGGGAIAGILGPSDTQQGGAVGGQGRAEIWVYT